MKNFQELKNRNPELANELEVMTREELLDSYSLTVREKEVYFMQSVALTNYTKLCIKINEVPRIDLVTTLVNGEDLKALLKANRMFLDELEK